MPTVSVASAKLFKILGKVYSVEEFRSLCFDFGIELDDVTSQKEIIEKETGAKSSNASDEEIYKIDVPANRYDLLCIEGLSRALLIYLRKEPLPNYHIKNSGPLQRIIMKKEVLDVRPVIVAAVLRDLTFDEDNYASFIDLQDKLHQNICRKRSLVAIGTHDLDTIEGPFTYEAQSPKDIVFQPLTMDKKMNADEFFKHVTDTNNHLKKYLHIIKDFPKYPVIYDKNRVVLSLPPIINGEHSKISLTTKNVLIEVTALDYTKANIVLNTMVTMFSQYCSTKFSVESVEVEGTDGKVQVYPDISSRPHTASIDYINRCIGVKIPSGDVVSLLNRMSIQAELVGEEVHVQVPPTRSDILHACDIMEDVAIGFGFDNLPKVLPPTQTVGKPQPLSKLVDLLRDEVAHAGYTEVLTWCLCSKEDNFKNLNRPDDGTAVLIANPKTIEFQCGRLTLLSGLLKSVSANKKYPLPLNLFETGDIIRKDSNTDTGSSNKRVLAAIHCNVTSGFEIIHGLLDRVMLLLGVQHNTIHPEGYYIKQSSDPVFFPGRSADVWVGKKKIGGLGVLHPEVLKNYDIPFPCSAVEIDIDLALAHWADERKKVEK